MFITFLTLLYPFAVWFGQQYIAPQWLALLLVAMVLLRRNNPFGKRLQWLWLAGVSVLAITTWLAQSTLPLKAYPVLINAVMLLLFATSLLRPPTVVERIAELTETNITPGARAYMRRVTQVWCGFFVINGSIALATVLWGTDAQWALYNGLVAYLLMGVLFGIEWMIRQRVKRREQT